MWAVGMVLAELIGKAYCYEMDPHIPQERYLGSLERSTVASFAQQEGDPPRELP